MSACNIVSIDNNESSFSPKIVNFQNGQLISNKENNLQCAAFTDSTNGATVMTVATNKMVYVGEEKSNNDLFYTLLTIRSKKTNKIRLVPINTLSLNVHIPKINTLLDSTLNDSVLGTRDLYKKFGSKKTKRKTEQLERMKLNISSVEEELRKTVADVEIKPEDLLLIRHDDGPKAYRPAINRAATTVEEVYDLNSIITQVELDSLEYLAEEVLKNDVGEDKLKPFVVKSIEIVKASKVATMRKCKLLLYIDAILKFFKVQVRQMKNKKCMDPYPDLIIEKLLNEFTAGSGSMRLRPLSMRDKAMSYIIILALHALDFQLDLEPLSTSFGCGIKKLMDVSKMLGARVLGQKGSVIIMKVPLPPPTNAPFSKRK